MDNPVNEPFIQQNPAPVVGSNPPPPSSTPITTAVSDTKTPNSRPKLGKVIATLFGLLLLVGGVSVGAILVQQNQQSAQHAAGTVPDGQSSGCCSNTSQCQGWFGSASVCGSGNNGACQSGNQCVGSSNCTPTHQCTNNDCGVSNGCGQTCNGGCGTSSCGGNNQACCTGQQNACNTGFHCVQSSQTCVSDSSSSVCGALNQACCTGQQNACVSGLSCFTNPANPSNPTCVSQTNGGGGSNWSYAGNCINVTSGTVQVQTFTGPSCPTTQNPQGTATQGTGTYCPTPAQGSCQQLDVVGSGQGVCSCNTTTSTPNPTPTATPGISAVCTNVAAYDTNWNPLTQTQLDALKPGNVVRFGVIGTTTGSFDMAKFTVNGTDQPTTSLQHTLNTQNVFYFDYTIPQGVSSFAVVAQLHSVELNDWF